VIYQKIYFHASIFPSLKANKFPLNWNLVQVCEVLNLLDASLLWERYLENSFTDLNTTSQRMLYSIPWDAVTDVTRWLDFFAKIRIFC